MAQHHRHEFAARQRCGITRADQLAVAQHGYTVGEIVDLFQKMGDEDDAEPSRLEISDDAKQHLHFLGIKAGGRLIEDQDLAGEINGARDRHHLLDGDGIAFERSRDVDVDTILRQQAFGPPVHLTSLNEPEAAGLAAEEEIFGYAQISEQIDFLIDGADPELLRIERVARIDLLAIERQLPLRRGGTRRSCI